jgi:hypothetical protein
MTTMVKLKPMTSAKRLTYGSRRCAGLQPVIYIVNPYSRQKAAEDEDDKDEDAKPKKVRKKPEDTVVHKKRATKKVCMQLLLNDLNFSLSCQADDNEFGEDFGDQANRIADDNNKEGSPSQKCKVGHLCGRPFIDQLPFVYTVQFPNRRSLLLRRRRGKPSSAKIKEVADDEDE